ncbi:Ubiquitin-like protein [Glarea lozoyensis ATCC 20868]|uniref:Ubiquitin-like protein n=1 Tax=Glarea lozoyensis (strain ATCC 20868 / MF5171) TaxID=1116229 RepID=S3CRE0_GLAL2|nr:Ubiquitin-like protein [Glarea lozoyensis ATCC 20868]EPE28235.1 Ubiquitin-like protein [Glarea lozoyensis ATCC 20868]
MADPVSSRPVGNGEQPTHTTSDALRTSSTSRSINPESNLEMSDLDASGVSKNPTTGAGPQSGLLNDVAIPHSSPIDSTFPTTTASTSIQPETASAVKDTRVENIPPSSSVGATSATTKATPADLSSSTNGENTSSAAASNPPTMSRLDSVAIGPSVETMPTVPTATEAGPVLVITLLLTSGARHPYKIDEKYLTKRNVNVPGVTENGKKDPFSISVYTLKELILREWREEWEAQPSSPSSIRLIYFGRLLDDKTALKGMLYSLNSRLRAYVPVAIEYLSDQEDETWDFIELACFLGLETSTADLWAVGRPSFLISRLNGFFQIILTLPSTECRLNADSANVVHMTVRPQDIVDEEDASKGKGMGRDRGDGESNAGCRCVVQ